MTTLTLAPPRDYPTLSLVGLAHGTSHFYHLLLPPLFPWLMPAFGLSFTEAGALMTVFFVVSGLGQAIAGFVVDRFGARRVLMLGLGTLSVAALVIGSATSYAMLLVGAALAGFGNSVFHPADYTILNRRVSPGRLGQAFSVHSLAGNAGWVLAPPFLAGIAALAGWRVAAFSAALVGLGTALILLQARDLIEDSGAARAPVPPAAPAPPETTVLPPAPVPPEAAALLAAPVSPSVQVSPSVPVPPAVPVPRAAPLATATVAPRPSAPRSFLQIPAVWLCFAFFLCTASAFGTLQNFAGPLLGRLYGLAPALAASCLTAYLLGSTAGTAVGGTCARADGAHQRTIAIALSASASAACLLATRWVPVGLVLPLLAVMGFGVGFTGPSRDLMVREAATARIGEAVLGRVYGFVYSGLDAGLALGPLMFGPLMDRQSFTLVMGGVAMLQIVAILVSRQVRLVSLGP
jgi:MFS family permease